MTNSTYMINKSKAVGFFMAAISAMFYGTSPAFVVPLYGTGLDTLSIVLFRYFLGLPVLGFLVWRKGEGFSLKLSEIIQLAAAGISMALSSYTLYESYLYINPGVASTLLFMYPVLTAILMMVFFNEKFRLSTGISLAIMGVGLYLLTVSPKGFDINVKGFILVFISSLTYAIYLVMVKVLKALKTTPTIKSLMYQLLFGSFMFMGLLIAGKFTMPESFMEWSFLFGLAMLPTVLSLLCTMRAISIIGPTPTAIFGALEPITAVILTVFFLNQPISLREICGGLFILFATLIVMMANRN